MATEIHTTNGKTTLVDDEYAWVAQYKWNWSSPKNSDPYVQSSINGEKALIHRFIVTLAQGPIPKGMVVHHLNHNTADNRLENLQVTTNGNNTYRSRAHEESRTTSSYRGVDWHKRTKRWRARVRVKRKLINIGYFVNELEAAQAAQKAREYYQI